MKTAQLAAHYAKLFTVTELRARRDATKAALVTQKARLRAVGGAALVAATVKAEEAEFAALVAAIKIVTGAPAF